MLSSSRMCITAVWLFPESGSGPDGGSACALVIETEASSRLLNTAGGRPLHHSSVDVELFEELCQTYADAHHQMKYQEFVDLVLYKFESCFSECTDDPKTAIHWRDARNTYSKMCVRVPC